MEQKNNAWDGSSKKWVNEWWLFLFIGDFNLVWSQHYFLNVWWTKNFKMVWVKQNICLNKNQNVVFQLLSFSNYCSFKNKIKGNFEEKTFFKTKKYVFFYQYNIYNTFQNLFTKWTGLHNQDKFIKCSSVAKSPFFPKKKFCWKIINCLNEQAAFYAISKQVHNL